MALCGDPGRRWLCQILHDPQPLLFRGHPLDAVQISPSVQIGAFDLVADLLDYRLGAGEIAVYRRLAQTDDSGGGGGKSFFVLGTSGPPVR